MVSRKFENSEVIRLISFSCLIYCCLGGEKYDCG